MTGGDDNFVNETKTQQSLMSDSSLAGPAAPPDWKAGTTPSSLPHVDHVTGIKQLHWSTPVTKLDWEPPLVVWRNSHLLSFMKHQELMIEKWLNKTEKRSLGKIDNVYLHHSPASSRPFCTVISSPDSSNTLRPQTDIGMLIGLCMHQPLGVLSKYWICQERKEDCQAEDGKCRLNQEPVTLAVPSFLKLWLRKTPKQWMFESRTHCKHWALPEPKRFMTRPGILE